MASITSDLIKVVASPIISGVFGLVTGWLITRRSITRLVIGVRIRMSPILHTDLILEGTNLLKIQYNGELLVEPILLSVDIINLGNKAIENPPITIEAAKATYVIPLYIEDMPPGYEGIWNLERTDSDSCAIKLEHINPRQIVKARFLLDELPTKMPEFKCPMKDLETRKLTTYNAETVTKTILDNLTSSMISSMGFWRP